LQEALSKRDPSFLCPKLQKIIMSDVCYDYTDHWQVYVIETLSPISRWVKIEQCNLRSLQQIMTDFAESYEVISELVGHNPYK